MVFVKVRETYDLHTLPNKMTVIGIHTPANDIIKKNYPGLLMQCKMYRPVSCDVRVACASMLPVDPLQVSTAEGDIAPEDLFNPILYKTMTNVGMSQIEARVHAYRDGSTGIGVGNTADYSLTEMTNQSDEFPLYYGLLSDTNGWRHASAQSGFSMSHVKPLVSEILVANGQNSVDGDTLSTNVAGALKFTAPQSNGTVANFNSVIFKGNSKPMPFINTTAYSVSSADNTNSPIGFPNTVYNDSVIVPAPKLYCACIIVPPSRLHQLYYRMVVEWTLEFTSIRSLAEITNWEGLTALGNATHYQSYDYSNAKTALIEDADKVEEMPNDQSMVSTDADITKVM